jgi:hypothetical protein
VLRHFLECPDLIVRSSARSVLMIDTRDDELSSARSVSSLASRSFSRAFNHAPKVSTPRCKSVMPNDTAQLAGS